MARSTATSTCSISYCTFCAHGRHSKCLGGDCACGGRAHDPDVETAAAMRRFIRPDLAKLPVEELATQWRRQAARSEAAKGSKR